MGGSDAGWISCLDWNCSVHGRVQLGFHPTSTKEGPDPVPHLDGLTATGEVVCRLLSKLLNSKYWIVYLDDYYSSLPLLGRLRHDFRMGGCEPHGRTQQDFPLNSKSQGRRLRSTSSLKAIALKDNLFSEEAGAHAWIDNAPVTVLSTVHDLGSEVVKIRERPGTKNTDAKVREKLSVMQRRKRCQFHFVPTITINAWVGLT